MRCGGHSLDLREKLEAAESSAGYCCEAQDADAEQHETRRFGNCHGGEAEDANGEWGVRVEDLRGVAVVVIEMSGADSDGAVEIEKVFLGVDMLRGRMNVEKIVVGVGVVVGPEENDARESISLTRTCDAGEIDGRWDAWISFACGRSDVEGGSLDGGGCCGYDDEVVGVSVARDV